MYLPIDPQPDCASAWLQSAIAVDRCPNHEAHNVIIDVSDPCSKQNSHIVTTVDKLLREKTGKSVATVSNTIFPKLCISDMGLIFNLCFTKTFYQKLEKIADGQAIISSE